jgi:copper chaperone
MATEKLHLTIEGMTCGHCEKFVTNVLKELDGVKDASASAGSKSADVTYDTDKVSKQQIIDAVNETHYKASA